MNTNQTHQTPLMGDGSSTVAVAPIFMATHTVFDEASAAALARARAEVS